ITLYQGGQYNLYRYKKYTDVRLVFVPEFQAAFFGGDPDNFNFPRFNIDMSLVRVYEKGQPVKSENYFKWSTAAPSKAISFSLPAIRVRLLDSTPLHISSNCATSASRSFFACWSVVRRC